MGEPSEIKLDIEGHVAVISLMATDRRNALTVPMAKDLSAACEEIDANPEIGAVVVRGEGGYFCAGAHRDVLAGTGEDPLSDPAYPNLTAVYGSFARVGRLEPPVVAAVRGGAVGAGLNLALAADLRIVATDAKLLAGFSRIGLHPGGGFFVIANRTAGREATAAMGLFGESVTGRRAVELGLAWEALPDDEVDARALALATQASADPDLARRTCRSFRNETGPPEVPWAVALDSERAPQMWSLRRKHLAGS